MNSEWIKCSEKLPVLREKVLITNINRNEMFVGWISYILEDGTLDWQYSDCCGCSAGTITHWQLLPEPPHE